MIYAYNANHVSSPDPEGPSSFNMSNPGTLNSIANQSPQDIITGGTWANGVWYGTTVNFPYKLVTIDPVTGSRTLVSNLQAPIMGLSINAVNNLLNGVAWNGANTVLFSIDPSTGVATQIGNCSTDVLINIAINNVGQAYALDITADVLESANLTTGLFTPIGSIGFDASFYQGMEFDRNTGDLFLAASSVGLSWLALVNTTTGATMKIGNFEGNAEITAMAIPYTSNITLNINALL